MISTYRFGFATAASPLRVWSALTDAAETSRYLRGVTLVSDWSPGAPISLRLGDMLIATGEVLAATPGERLSLAIEGGHGPDTYLTWTIRPAAAHGGAVVGLAVDELADGKDGDADARAVEDDWLPPLADLHALLAAEAGDTDAGDADAGTVVSRRAAP
jgi:uncharacterized protein YndB with AHSA1/START domain